MSIDPRNGRSYEYSPEQTLPDVIAEERPTPPAVTRQYLEAPDGRRYNRPTHDPILGIEQPDNPDGSDFGPLYIHPKYDRWLMENILGPGYMIDWGNREIFESETGRTVGTLPDGPPPVE